MDFPVVRSRGGYVHPSGPTPTGTLDLSVIDRLPVLRCDARTLHVFRHGHKAAEVIKEAVSKALVPYYPLAGCLINSSQGELQIECPGEGLWFVEASANCTLEAVKYFDDAASIRYDLLLPDHPPEAKDPLVQMQITQFACDGFVIGLTFCHSICDGLGAAQFLNAVGEIARGAEHLSVLPVWLRNFLTPPQPATSAKPTLPPPMPNYKLEHANVDILLDQINQLKQDFQESTGQHCSAFEIVAASMWSRRTRAISLDRDAQVTLVFFANCRQILNPPLAQGFYGNCFFPVTVRASSEMLKKASIVEVVKLIKDGKARLQDEFGKWSRGECLDGVGDPFAPPLTYTTLFISEWGRLGFNEIDYGWGHPVHVVPVQGSSIIPVGIVGLLPSPMKGIRLMTWCVEQAHLLPFLHQMNELSPTSSQKLKYSPLPDTASNNQ
ncbi:hypothetical protein RJ641_030683 [Dillenia turbinata]|uniref:Uncharacterized protein n=1 Tax=Dillenia turbinata TaxID=194707 RepID=A0AAN8W426_9MAGN